MKRLSRAKQLVVCAAVLLVCGGAIGVFQAAGSAKDTVAPIVDPGVTPVQDAQTVESQVLDALGDGAYISKVYVLAHHSEVGNIVSSAPTNDGPESTQDGVVWVVLAHGHFEPISAVNETDDPTPSRDVYELIDDATGMSLGAGTIPSGSCQTNLPCP